MAAILSALAAGVLFGAGLALSGMTEPAVVLGFLDVAGAWNPSLAFVMAGALAVAIPGFAWTRARGRPLFAERLAVPTASAIDARLLAGAAIFGVGWGLVGLCPGPAVANLAGLSWRAAVFVAAMAAGMALYRALGPRT